ncbi:hypothetical protein [Actinomadura rubrisoli]|uniref:Winged helix-turn-helix transcriptional regulator n=1 Tax=Actinomadura rubrisoli TaxID=2530368 RepID=A0A4V2YZL0_9ACTN|nr:hypothetical protein [Actinomadura rubrisoli]TDD97677.1 hypothetical protein E1298_01180 [Actinomadura rubrisoli]
MITTNRFSSSIWDDVEHAILRAAQRPSTCREIATVAGLTPDTVKTQIDVQARGGLIVQSVDGGVRYQLTVAGWKRLFALADTARPGQQAAA